MRNGIQFTASLCVVLIVLYAVASPAVRAGQDAAPPPQNENSPEPIKALAATALNNSNPAAAREAWESLAKSATPRDFSLLLPVLENPQDLPFTRLQTQLAAMSALLQIAHKEKERGADKLVQDLTALRPIASTIGKLRIVELLGKLNTPAARNQLIAYMSDPDAEVIRSAVATLDFTESPAALAALMRLAGSRDLELKKAAVLALGRCKRSDALPALIPLLDTSERGVQANVVWAIHNITGKDFASAALAQQWFDTEKKDGAAYVQLLLEQLKNGPQQLKPLVVEDLGKQSLQLKEVTLALQPYLSHTDFRVRAAVCGVLGKGEPSSQALGRLIQSLRDNSDVVSHSAWRALRQLTWQQLPREYDAWNEWLRNHG